MVDHAAARLVVAGEAGKDRQAGRVCGGPAGGPNPVREQAPGRTGPGMPVAALLREAAELVEAAGAAVEQERVVVAAALDVDALRDRVADVVALVVVLEGDARPRRLASDDVEGDADRRAFPEAGAEVSVKPGVDADRGDERRRVGGNRQAVDTPVPRIRLREDGAALRRGKAQGMRGAAGARESEGDDCEGSGAGAHA